MPRKESFVGYNHKRCSHCKEVKNLDEFRKVTQKRPTRRSECRICEQRYKKREKYKQNQKEYSKRIRKIPEIHAKTIKQCKDYGLTVRGRANRLYNAAKQRSKINNLVFEIPQAYIEIVLHLGVCERTGIPFDFSSPAETKFNPFSPSLDRKNPFKGYTIQNTQVVCNAYNFAKHQMSDEQFLNFCKIVVSKNT